ncbi:membrane protein of ER body-like protein [Zingiber officinale]|uniref:membrane protein of ER body-like protein n=1 Tax=Zingiber officinale TaxID=94328 RepID=UPI001C4DAE32|nr:membrane protein of ER body-like protein [Zingiber officinale]
MELERVEAIVDEEEEGEGGGLEARQRRRKADSYGAPPQAEESSGEEAEESCLSDDADPVWTSGVELKKNDQNVIQEELANGKSTSDIVDDHKGITTEGENQMLKNANVENGSKPQDYPKVRTNIMTKSEEITVFEHITVQKKNALEAVEFDLERILDEQDTHDLYCPNCKSCITKRVILRKRKRTVKEIQHDMPSKKAHEEQYVVEKTVTEASPDHLTNRDDAQEPDIYRCLSCFSFFIPIVGGFNIFRIFEKGKEISKKVSEEKVDSTSSMVKVDEIKSKGTEPGISSPDESSSISSRVDQLVQKDTAPSPSFPGSLNFVEGQSISQNNDGLLITRDRKGIFNREITAGGGEMDDHSQVKPNLGIPIEAGELDDNGIATEAIDADIPVSGFPTVGFFEQLKEQIEHYDPSTQIISTPGATIQIEEFTDTVIKVGDFITKSDTDSAQITFRSEQKIEGSQTTTTNVLLRPDDVQIAVPDQTFRESEISNSWDLLKSIVFGGLTESITSLGVVSSAAGVGASTLNIFALGLANLIGGFLVIVHELFELRAVQDHPTEQTDERVGRYWEVLGQRAKFRLHFVVAIISYIIVGLLPPVIYGFSFWKSDNREYKLLSVSGASLLCIALLAIGKAHVKPEKPYLKTLFYYLSLGVSASGISYVAGVMVNTLIEKLGLFDHTAAPSSQTTFLPQVSSSRVLSSPWASS